MVSATGEMADTLVRTAYSSLLYDDKDFGAAIMSASGDMWAETPGVIVFSRTFPGIVRAGIARWKGRFSEGDVLVANDPFDTGTHISDTSIYMPVFVEGQLVAFCGMAAHWADVGGKAAGGWCPDTTDMFQEGLCFRHQKIIEAGTLNQGLWDLIADNVRVPVTVHGDLQAQIAACARGADRVRTACAKYGRQTVLAAMDRIIHMTDLSMRAAIGSLPDGEYSGSIRLDEDGVNPHGDFLACLRVTICGERVIFSTRGSAPVARGPVNLPEPCTRGILASSLKGILMPFDATNEGHTKCLEFDIPSPSILSPPRPAPTDSYGYLVVCLMELMFRCFAKIVPHRCPAGGYQLSGATISRTEEQGDHPFVMIDTTHGGNGALFNHDGITNQLVGNGDLPTVPTEVLETRYPVRIDCIEYAPEVGGAGKFRGGMGVRKDLRLIENGCFLVYNIENTKDPTAVGVDGGSTALPGYAVLNPDTPSRRIFNRAAPTIGPLPGGTVFRIVTGGGGGWGIPFDRDPLAVLADVRDEFLDPQRAEELYGVAVVRIVNGWDLDTRRTQQLRAQQVTMSSFKH
jgi:N-methylhydantoinase B